MRTYEVTRGPHYNAEPIIAIPEPHYKHLISCERYRELRQIISSRNHARLEQGFPTWGTCTPGVHLPIRRGISKVRKREGFAFFGYSFMTSSPGQWAKIVA